MLKLLKKFTKTEWTLSFAALLFIILQVWMDLTIPDYMSEITTLVQTEGSAMSEILAAGGKMLGCALGSFAASVCTVTCARRSQLIFLPIYEECSFIRCSPSPWRISASFPQQA